LRLNRSGEGTTDLVIVRGKRVYFSKRDRPMPTQPSSFAMVLRKHLGNGRLVGVEQHGFDRILTLRIDTKVGELRLVIELFRDGNIILLDPSGVIIQPLTHVTYASRTLKRGVIYEWPPEQVDPRNLDASTLAKILDESDADLARTLASRLNLGGPYAHAVLAAAGIESSLKAAILDDAGRTSLHSALAEMLGELANGSGAFAWYASAEAMMSVKGGGVTSDGEVSIDNSVLLENESEAEMAKFVEAGPVRMVTNDDALAAEFESLSAAVDAWKGGHDAAALHRREEEKLEEAGEDESANQDRLARRAAQQEAAITKFLAKAAKTQATAAAIKDNWTHLDDLLRQVCNAVQVNGLEAVSKQVKSIEWIESLDAANRTMNAFLPDENGNPGIRVTLHFEESVHQNSQRFFEAAKTQKEKSSGAIEALKRTEKERARDEKKAAKEKASGKVRGLKRSKRFWFERHRWAILSGGTLLVGGRDAKGNDAIVRKHLGSEDAYIHADLHGAPSCVLKRGEGLSPVAETGESKGSENDSAEPKNSIPKLTINQTLKPRETETTEDTKVEIEIDEMTGIGAGLLVEAAQMAVCWSRAWASGGAAATAYHVRPSQVSKKTESGEALGRGAFVVRGKRMWHRDLPLEIGFGIAIINGVPLPITGPVAAIKSVCGRWAKIVPGQTKKENIANRIAKSTGLVQDDVLAALPSGKCDISDDNGLLN
jgi:predicted ribosome quality control (RQC) complex YloA/Tae2 family protein